MNCISNGVASDRPVLGGTLYRSVSRSTSIRGGAYGTDLAASCGACRIVFEAEMYYKLSRARVMPYAKDLCSVEVNYTFRSFPAGRLLQNWMAATPAEFKFAIKAHQKITHFKRLRGAAQLATEFIAALEPLEKAEKLGPVLFQLPPNLKCDVPLLTEFLAGLPSHLQIAFEFRDASWFADEVFAALRKRNVAVCLAESETIQTPPVQTADFFYLRLRKDEYSAKSLREHVQKIADLGRRGGVFAYFKHEETPQGALHAEAVLKETNGN